MTVHCLGTGSAGAGADRTTSMLAVEAAGHTVLIDCGGDAVQRLLASGLDPVALNALVLTHEHPDHLSGYPLLLEKLWQKCGSPWKRSGLDSQYPELCETVPS